MFQTTNQSLFCTLWQASMACWIIHSSNDDPHSFATCRFFIAMLHVLQQGYFETTYSKHQIPNMQCPNPAHVVPI